MSYEIERKRAQDKQFQEKAKSHGLIPSTSGPPANIFGQHLPTMDEPEEERGKKKKEKGVWYVPWYEDEDEMNSENIDSMALATMDSVLRDISAKGIVWEIDSPKGKKSRANWTEYMQLVGVAMWRVKKSVEDEDPLFSEGKGGGVSKMSSGASSKHQVPERGAGAPDGSTIGGPANSANVLGRGQGRGGKGRGSRGRTARGRR